MSLTVLQNLLDVGSSVLGQLLEVSLTGASTLVSGLHLVHLNKLFASHKHYKLMYLLALGTHFFSWTLEECI